MKKIFEQKGQSLVEVMVALFVLTTGLLGILTLLAQSIHTSKMISTETTATYLAAEGIELTKNLIDHDVYYQLAGFGGGWGNCFGLGTGTSRNYELDYAQTSCPLPAYSASDFLYYNPATHLYSRTNSAGLILTGFTRRIRVTIVNSAEIDVQSSVYWPTGAFTTQSVDLEDQFYNWHP